ncbi:MAG TPA: site-specific integrase, partial [Pirellulales bacterium]|nr:site-specific integrase [Pirellulales bacterium]
MSRPARIPQPSRHKASGQAVVRLNGKDFYLGPDGSEKAKAAYERLIGQWLANGRQLPTDQSDALSVEEILARYWDFAEQYYVKDGKPTREQNNIVYALRPLEELYGDTLATAFGPLALKAVREKMIESGLARKVINQRIGAIKRVFRWAVSEELLPPSVYQALAAVNGLKRGRTKARETKPIEPVSENVVDATLPFLPKVVADMVQFQRFTGCRPGEVCALRPCDIDRTGEIWEYRPASHKSEHHGRDRVILIGPKAQTVLLPYLLRAPEAFCFSPAESESRRKAELRARRRSKVQPSQRDRSRPNPKRKPRNSYDRQAYLHAVRRACRKADIAAHKQPEYARVPLVRIIIPNWHPNQLRHLAATE